MSSTSSIFLPRASTVERSVDSHAVMTGTVMPSATAPASLKVIRGRRAHARQVESLMFGVKLGRRRRWNVFTPTSVPANLSVMYRLMPLTIDQAMMRNVTPMKTPMSEKPLLSFCARTCCSASRTASKNDIR